MTTRGGPFHDLREAVQGVRAAVADASYPLPLPSAGSVRAEQAALLAQLDDYALPRLARLDAPLLVVVGGSTGAGKSTLVNSLVQAPVSPAGVRRPTTRTPVLACHPADTGWFRSGAPLGGLSPIPPITAPALRAGTALLDVPDFDAVVDANREIAHRLLAAADLWLFVTTAARYADAVPWELLDTARQRGTVVALVLDRVPQRPGASAADEIVAHLTELLTWHGLGNVPLFVLPETHVGGHGLLPEEAVTPLRSWLNGLATDTSARGAVARCTLDGALAALPPRVEALAAAADAQMATAEELAEQVGLAYGGARTALERSLPEAAAPTHPGRTQGPRWRPGARAADQQRRAAWEAGLVRLVSGVATDAAEQTQAAWRAHPVGQAMLGPAPPAGPSAGLAGKVERLVRAWDGEAPRELLDRFGELLDAEAARWLDGLGAVSPDGGPGRRLRTAAVALENARAAAGLQDPPAGAAPADPPDPTGNPGSDPGSGSDPGPGGDTGDPAGSVDLDRAGR